MKTWSWRANGDVRLANARSCAGSYPALFCLLLFVAQTHCALLPACLLLIPQEGVYHMLHHDTTLVGECCGIASNRCTWGSACRRLDVWIEHHGLQIRRKSVRFAFVKTRPVTDVDKVENISQCERCQMRGGLGGVTGFLWSTQS